MCLHNNRLQNNIVEPLNLSSSLSARGGHKVNSSAVNCLTYLGLGGMEVGLIICLYWRIYAAALVQGLVQGMIIVRKLTPSVSWFAFTQRYLAKQRYAVKAGFWGGIFAPVLCRFRGK